MAALCYPIIAGPTASGKSALAVSLAKAIGGEVVSADSMQVYGGVHVGTARPTAEEMEGVVHHLLGFLSLDDAYSVAAYMEDAHKVFSDIFARGCTPILCGGTGLYIQSFMENRQLLPQSGDPMLREQLLARAADQGGAVLLDELRQVDPETAVRLHENDVHRIVRALEVYRTTGQTIAQQTALSLSQPSPYTPCLFVLNFRDRNRLYARIDQRVDRMLEHGLIEEAKTVLSRTKDATVLQAIGYKELLPYLSGQAALAETVENLKTQTRHYAKRQLSWFRRMQPTRMIYVDDYADSSALLQDVLKQYDQFVKERV